VNYAPTGQPTPVRLRITRPEGQYFAPLGRLPEFATGRNQDVGGNVLLGMKPHAYIDGRCEVRLPAGPLLVEISKGFEYAPLRQEVVLKPGQLSLRFGVERWTDFRRQGWFSGDARAHFLTPHAALLEAAAEDLAVANLLAVECRVPGSHGKDFRAIPNLLAFSGQLPALAMPGHMVVVNTHNSHPVLGSLGLLNCHRVVFPLTFGEPVGLDDWTLADWCDQCHRKGGLVVWTRTSHEGSDFAYGEPLADLVLGKVDAFEVNFFEDSPFDVLPDWYGLLNCGLRVPLVGASGKDSNGVALGAMRTYAQLNPGDEFTYQTWIETVRAGRTFVTNSPLLTFTVNGCEPGETVDLDAGVQSMRIQARAESVAPFDRLEIVQNGNLVSSAEVTGTPHAAKLDLELPVSASGWWAARCRGEHPLFHRPANQRVFAHTSPVYVNAAGCPFQGDRNALNKFLAHLDRMEHWARVEARCDSDRQRHALAKVFQNARRALLERTTAANP
jgi:hypothetical protein